jgi:8-oxo-dGTP diphosphatase
MMSEINWKNKCWVTTIYLINNEKKVLLTWNKNMKTWIPVGGHLNPGETPVEAIKREVEEETRFEFEFFEKESIENNGKVRVIKPYRIQIEEVPHHNCHMNIVFFGKCTKYTSRRENDENEKLRWFSEEELIRQRDDFLESVWNLSILAINKMKERV